MKKIDLNTALKYTLRENHLVLAYLAVLIWGDIVLITSLLLTLGTAPMLWVVASCIGMVLITCSVVLFAKNLVDAYKTIADPVSRLFRNEIVERPDQNLLNITEEFAQKEKIVSPKLVVISSPIVGSFGFSPSNSLVFIGREIIQMLNVSELRAVLSHEIFHIKNDLVYTSSYLMFKDMFLRPVNLALVSVIGLIIAGISVPVINASLPRELFLLLMFGPELVFLSIFVLLVAHRLSAIIKPGSLSSVKHLFFREFLADAYTVIALNDSLSLRNAIIKIARLNLDKQIKSRLLSLLKNSTFGGVTSKEIPRFSLERRPFVEGLTVFSRLKASPKEVEDIILSSRVGIIDLVAHLMNGNVKIGINNKEQIRLSRTVLSMTPEAMANVLANNKAIILKIVKTLSSASNFNLTTASAQFGINQFDMFVILLFLYNSGFVKLE